MKNLLPNITLFYLLSSMSLLAQSNVNGFVHPNGNIEITLNRARVIHTAYRTLELRLDKCDTLVSGLNAIITDQAAYMTKTADSLTTLHAQLKQLHATEVKQAVKVATRSKRYSIGVGVGATYSIPRSKIEPVFMVGVMRNLWSF